MGQASLLLEQGAKERLHRGASSVQMNRVACSGNLGGGVVLALESSADAL